DEREAHRLPDREAPGSGESAAGVQHHPQPEEEGGEGREAVVKPQKGGGGSASSPYPHRRTEHVFRIRRTQSKNPQSIYNTIRGLGCEPILEQPLQQPEIPLLHSRTQGVDIRREAPGWERDSYRIPEDAVLAETPKLED